MREIIAPTCICGCESFVWWIEKEHQYSTETARVFYSKTKHFDARCYKCNREVVRRVDEKGGGG